ncbi:MAG: hypothetical protein ABFS32_22710 [Bacteroidota bacterium]
MSDSYTDWAWPWWSVIVAINAINILVLAMVYKRSIYPKGGHDSIYRKRMRIMGVIFTLVGAYRAIFVSRYITQMAWFDSIANSALLIRILAMAAELSFSGLFALAMLRVNRDMVAENTDHDNRFSSFMMTKSPYILMISIFFAQFFATGGLITRNKMLFAIEETLWTFGFLAVLPLAIHQLRRVVAMQDVVLTGRLKMLKRFTILNVTWIVLYCSYGLLYHLPFESWVGAFDQMNTGLPVIRTGISAVADAFTIVNESKEYSDWGIGFLFWHSAYFTVCVWISIFLMQAPRLVSLSESPKVQPV